MRGTGSTLSRPGRRFFGRPLRLVIEIAVVALAIEYVLLPQLVGSGKTLSLLGQVRPGWIGLAVVAEVISLAAFAGGTRAMLRPSVRPRFERIARIDLATIALSHSVPGGGPAGTALGIRLMGDARVGVGDAAFAKVAQGLGSAVVLQALLLTGLVVAVPTQGGTRLDLTMAIVGVVIVTVVIGLAVTVRRARHHIATPLGWLTRRLPFVPDDSGHRLVTSVGDLLDTALDDHRRLLVAAGFAAGNWLADAAALWCSVRAFGQVLTYVDLIVPYAIAATLSWVPVTPGGLGIVEGALVPLLVGYGCGKTVAVLGVITWRLVAFWLPIPLGFVAYVSLSAGRRSAEDSGVP